jgi:hypothetical protein
MKTHETTEERQFKVERTIKNKGRKSYGKKKNNIEK